MSRRSGTCWRALCAFTAIVVCLGIGTADADDWPVGTMTDLGGHFSVANAVSANGSVVVGLSDNAAGDRHAASWANGATTPTDLGTLGGNFSNAIAVSADGSVIVGAAYNTASTYHAASWTNGATTPTDLGTLGGDSSVANAVNADGTVIVGWSYNAASYQRAAFWTNGATTPTDLGTLGGSYSNATAVSADGSIIVGWAFNAADNSHAVSWTNGATTPTNLGTLGGNSSAANTVSANGLVIVGYASNAAGATHAASWTNGATTPTDLGALGGDASGASAVSADGSVIVGYANTSSGATHAFALRVKAAPIMQDLDNIYLSIPLLADDTAVAFDRQAGVLTDMLGAFCRVPSGAHWCRDTTLSGLAISGQQDDLTGMLSLGYAFSEQITGGIALAATAKGRIGGGAFDIAATPSFGLWSSYSFGGAAGTGFQADLAAAYGKTHADITRGLGLDNVEAVSGRADLATLAAKAGIGYGLAARQWLLTPSLSVATYRFSRSAYDEDASADFPARYEKLATSLTTATFSVAAEHPVGNTQRVAFQAGIVGDLDRSEAGLAGTSNIPGMGTISQPETLRRNRARPFLAASYSLDIDTRSTLSVGAGVSRAAYGSDPAFSLRVGFGTAF